MVHAQNKKGVKRQFSDKAWELLPTGKDGTKEGFSTISEQPISNAKKLAAKPDTGGGKKSGPVIEQKIKNVVPDGDSARMSEDEKGVKTKTIITEEAKAEFLKSADGINLGVIKDYFDKNKIRYGKKDAPEVLYEQLGTALNFDVVELQKLFS